MLIMGQWGNVLHQVCLDILEVGGEIGHYLELIMKSSLVVKESLNLFPSRHQISDP